MTVHELRAECKRLGLPTYQHRGRRLKKADLVRFLANGVADVPGRPVRRSTVKATPEPSRTVGTRPVEPYGVEPAPPKRPQSGRCPARRLTDADRLVKQLAAMPTTPEESMAIYRMLNGTATPTHDGILKRREGRACEALAERARTEQGRLKWHGRYLAATGVML